MLGQYLGAGASTTKLLLHLNGNSTDSSGNNNNGTDTNITYSQANGRFGVGAGFNGTTSNISIPDTGNYLDFRTGDFTISGWYYATAGNDRYLFAKGNGERISQYWLRNENASNQLRFLTAKGSGSTILEPDSTTTVTLNTWQHIIARRSGTELSIFINGKKVKSITGTVRNCDNSYNLYVGIAGSGSGEAYQGNMDELIVENTAWSDAKISKYYTMAKGRFGII